MKHLVLTGFIMMLVGCAGSPSTATLPTHTILKEGGVYQTSGYGMSQDASEKAAVYNANESCSLQKKAPIVSKKDSRYQGTVGEDLNKAVTMVSAIIKSTIGKDYGSTATDKDYKTTLDFRCQ